MMSKVVELKFLQVQKGVYRVIKLPFVVYWKAAFKLLLVRGRSLFLGTINGPKRIFLTAIILQNNCYYSK
jgi:hypothetical protein